MHSDHIDEQSEALEAEFNVLFDEETRDQPDLHYPHIRRACFYFFICGGSKALKQACDICRADLP